jgi:hypothetical protein
MLFDIVKYKDIDISWQDFLEYIEEVKKEEVLRDIYESKYRKSLEYQNNKDKYERILRLGNFQFKTIFDNIYNKKNKDKFNNNTYNKIEELYKINNILKDKLQKQEIITYTLSIFSISFMLIKIYNYII